MSPFNFGTDELESVGVTSSSNLQPAQPRNRLALRHGFFLEHFTETDQALLEALTEAYRERCPAYSRSLDPLLELAASITWRIGRANADISEHGLPRGKNAAAAVLKHLEAAERMLVTILGRLGMTTKDAADLGLVLTRARRESIDMARLSPDKRALLYELLKEAGATVG